VTRLAHTFAARLAARGRGASCSSGPSSAGTGVLGQANYAASKAYIQSLAERLHDELAPQAVDVLSVAPGPVASGFGARAGLSMDSVTTAEVVANAALNAIGRRRTVIPGARGKFLTTALRPLPRPLRSRILGAMIAGMHTPTTAFVAPPP
jgi:short-subunit dehydrogenase